mmetsp:Transcript_10272/g.16808  ORF Transcript_10272/g.16808 Transcript_10272/m.16808 type:complete len:214 (-) Transcript_10272:295-936(-)
MSVNIELQVQVPLRFCGVFRFPANVLAFYNHDRSLEDQLDTERLQKVGSAVKSNCSKSKFAHFPFEEGSIYYLSDPVFVYFVGVSKQFPSKTTFQLCRRIRELFDPELTSEKGKSVVEGQLTWQYLQPLNKLCIEFEDPARNGDPSVALRAQTTSENAQASLVTAEEDSRMHSFKERWLKGGVRTRSMFSLLRWIILLLIVVACAVVVVYLFS